MADVAIRAGRDDPLAALALDADHRREEAVDGHRPEDHAERGGVTEQAGQLQGQGDGSRLAEAAEVQRGANIVPEPGEHVEREGLRKPFLRARSRPEPLLGQIRGAPAEDQEPGRAGDDVEGDIGEEHESPGLHVLAGHGRTLPAPAFSHAPPRSPAAAPRGRSIRAILRSRPS